MRTPVIGCGRPVPVRKQNSPTGRSPARAGWPCGWSMRCRGACVGRGARRPSAADPSPISHRLALAACCCTENKARRLCTFRPQRPRRRLALSSPPRSPSISTGSGASHSLPSRTRCTPSSRTAKTSFARRALHLFVFAKTYGARWLAKEVGGRIAEREGWQPSRKSPRPLRPPCDARGSAYTAKGVGGGLLYLRLSAPTSRKPSRPGNPLSMASSASTSHSALSSCRPPPPYLHPPLADPQLHHARGEPVARSPRLLRLADALPPPQLGSAHQDGPALRGRVHALTQMARPRPLLMSAFAPLPVHTPWTRYTAPDVPTSLDALLPPCQFRDD